VTVGTLLKLAAGLLLARFWSLNKVYMVVKFCLNLSGSVLVQSLLSKALPEFAAISSKAVMVF
jgi:hypothetical protein